MAIRRFALLVTMVIFTFALSSGSAQAYSTFTINNGDAWTNDPNVELNCSAPGDSQYRVSNSYFMTLASWYSLSSWFATIPWELDYWSDGQKTVYMEFRGSPTDTAQKWYATIGLDTYPPTTRASSVPTDWVKSAEISLSASDSGSGVDYTEYQIDGGLWTRYYFGCQVTAPLGTKATRTVSYRSVDIATNVEKTNTVSVNIDNTVPDTAAPSTTVSGCDTRWHAAPVQLAFAATDPGLLASGVAYTEYRVDGYAWLRANTMTVNAPAGGANDGVHKVEYRSVDNARNTETTKSAIVRVDTVGPRGKAQNVVVKRGKTCKLWFDVDDSISPKVTMALYVKTRGGSTKARWSWGYLKTWLRDDWWWYQKYTCRLKKGTYRIEVYSHDLARNHQSRIGRAKLVVK